MGHKFTCYYLFVMAEPHAVKSCRLLDQYWAEKSKGLKYVQKRRIGRMKWWSELCYLYTYHRLIMSTYLLILYTQPNSGSNVLRFEGVHMYMHTVRPVPKDQRHTSFGMYRCTVVCTVCTALRSTTDRPHIHTSHSHTEEVERGHTTHYYDIFLSWFI